MTGTKNSNHPIVRLNNFVNSDSAKKQLEDAAKENAGAYRTSLLNLVRNSDQLLKCTPDSIMSAVLKPAALNLPIEPSLGFCYIIAYGNQAQFQLGYKGYIQLCIRTGQYKTIHCSEVYEDEIKYSNPITGEVIFNDPESFKMRYDGDQEKVVGFYACFELNCGFKCSGYMTKKEVLAHGKQFSKAYQYDLNKNKKSSLWTTNPVAMGRKTVLKLLLSRYGIMSIELASAFEKDTETFVEAEERTAKTITEQTGAEVTDVNFEETPEYGFKDENQPAFMK